MYIQYSEFRANSVFRASVSCSEILNDEKDIQNSEKFQGTRCFSGRGKVAQNF